MSGSVLGGEETAMNKAEFLLLEFSLGGGEGCRQQTKYKYNRAALPDGDAF